MKTILGNSSKFNLDHTFDTQPYIELESEHQEDVSTISGGARPSQYDITLLESQEERKKRKRSHIIAYLTMFVMSIGFSIAISGVWPYLQLLDDTLTKTAMGWVIAANPLGQLIASPIVGYIGNRLGSIRLVCYGTMTMFILGNLLYSFLPALTELWAHSGFHLMILARFITGLSSSNVALCRSYVAGSTTIQERTTAISIISAAQASGFVVGPALQAILSLSLDKDMLKYRSCGWIGALLGLVNFVLLTPFVFKVYDLAHYTKTEEYNIAEKEIKIFREQSSGKEEEYSLPKLNYLGIFGILFAFFINQFVYVLLESLLEPFVTDQFSWCDNFAVIVVGGALAFVGLLALPMFFTATRLAKKFDERKILMLCAFVPISIGLFLMLPWGPGTLSYCPESSLSTTSALPLDNYPEMNDVAQSSNSNQSLSKFCDPNECYGCPSEQTWCIDYPAIPKAQFFSGFVIVCSGYPFGLSMSNSIFSKMLGPKPQGLWMGILTASGSFARVTGPIFVSYTYTGLGSRWLFGILIVMMFLALGEITILFKQLVPMRLPKKKVDKV